jgi:hypothetical protein
MTHLELTLLIVFVVGVLVGKWWGRPARSWSLFIKLRPPAEPDWASEAERQR